MPNLLKIRKIKNALFLAIDPETNFWALVKEKNQANKVKYPRSLRDELRSGIIKRSEEVFLDLIEIHPNSSCNMDCEYCYVPRSIRASGKYLKYEKLWEIVNKIALYAEKCSRRFSVVFHSGEPLISKENVFQVIEDFHKARIDFSIQTNATLIKEDDLLFMKQYNVMPGISLDGFENVHNKARKYWTGNGTFNDVLKTIRLLKENYMPIGLITVVSKYNFAYLPKIIAFYSQIGVRDVNLNPISPTNMRAKVLSPKTTELLSNYKKAIMAAIDKEIIITNVEALLLNIISDVQNLLCHLTPCGAGRLMLVIDASGDVYPCSQFIRFREFKCGNILEEDITKLLESKPCKMLRDRITNKIDKCSLCEYKNICCAPCPSDLYALYRIMNKPSYYCDFWKGLIDFIFYLISQYQDDIIRLIRPSLRDYIKNSEYYYRLQRRI